jgi:putative phosphoesterase
MRLVVLADVHSNLHALRTVLEDVEAKGADMIICAGDIVGYGAFPNECCEIVSKSTRAAVCGNHDLSALSEDIEFMNPYAAAAVLWTSKRLRDSSRSFLSSLRTGWSAELSGRKVVMFHGSPEDVNEYIYEEYLDKSILERQSADMVILGHTHVPFVARLGSGVVVNPGSVGQPRDGDPRASYAVIELPSLAAHIIRREYDIDSAARAIKEQGLPEILSRRLSVGR